MSRRLVVTLALAAGAAGAAVLAAIGLYYLALALYNMRRNQVGIGGEPVREPASYGLLLIVAVIILVLLFALARTPRPVFAALTTLGFTAIAAAVILPVAFLAMMATSSFGAPALFLLAVVLVAACGGVIATRVQRAHERRAQRAQVEGSNP